MEVKQEFGCEMCFNNDADAAFQAAIQQRFRMLIDESHFIFQITGCRCGQRFGMVSTERVDWADGDDDQDWRLVPLTQDEFDEVMKAEPDQALEVCLSASINRRCLVRSHPIGGTLPTFWVLGGFSVRPHD